MLSSNSCCFVSLMKLTVQMKNNSTDTRVYCKDRIKRGRSFGVRKRKPAWKCIKAAFYLIAVVAKRLLVVSCPVSCSSYSFWFIKKKKSILKIFENGGFVL